MSSRINRETSRLWHIGDVKYEATSTRNGKSLVWNESANEYEHTIVSAVDGVTFTIGAEGGNSINVGLQLTLKGEDVAEQVTVDAYLSDDSDGSSIAATAPDGNVAIGTDGVLIPIVADKAFKLVSESDGDIDLDIGESAADTFYLVVVLPNGQQVISDAITFA